MVQGYYTAASGIISQQKNINVISNNIANVSTNGFKSQSTIGTSFGDHLIYRMQNNAEGDSAQIGKGTYRTAIASEYTDFTQGTIEKTGRSLDMAISGAGFFVVDSADNGQVLTRNGAFELDKDGYLMLSGVGNVLNQDGKKIKLSGSSFTVNAAGEISQNGKQVDKLYIATVKDGATLSKVGEDAYRSANGYQKADTKSYNVVQGATEKSNVNLAQEMSKIMAGQNNFQSNAQILKIFDQINEIAVNQIGKLG